MAERSQYLPKKALVAMSGGVDSSVTAALLVEQGVETTGVTFRLPHYTDDSSAEGLCCGVSGIKDARRVCQRLGIKHYVLDYRDKFENTVMKNFYEEYARGRTPNPCVRCNDWLKFGSLMQTARNMDIPTVVTGHYVRSRYNDETLRYELIKGSDNEDQSYFLFTLSQDQLSHACFPLGALSKEEVRKKALQAGLAVHDKSKSQDLCFLPNGRYGDLFKDRRPELLKPGDIVHVSGKKIGRHNGVALYTIGQRKGLGIAWHEPLYVVDIHPAKRELIVGGEEDVQRKEIRVENLNWIAIPPPKAGEGLQAEVKIRFRHEGAGATVTVDSEDKAVVVFDVPQKAPTPGQAAVFYREDFVLGGGFIQS